MYGSHHYVYCDLRFFSIKVESFIVYINRGEKAEESRTAEKTKLWKIEKEIVKVLKDKNPCSEM